MNGDADDLAALLDALDLKDVTLMGLPAEAKCPATSDGTAQSGLPQRF